MTTKRILFVQPVLAPYAIPRYRLLAECKGLEVLVALEAETFRERPGWQSGPIEGCHVEVLKAIRYTKRYRVKNRHFTEKYTKSIPYGLISTIRRQRPDAVIVCNPTQLLIARLASLRYRIAIGLLLEDTLLSEMRKSKLVQRLRKRLYRTADFVFCFSQDAQTYARHLKLRGQIYRTSWSINPTCHEPMPLISTVGQRHRPVKDNSKIRFLYVGALTELKGVRLLLQAWRSFAMGAPDAELIIVGDGNLKLEMKDSCSSFSLPGVQFTGHLAPQAVSEQYSNADVFILPTLQDLFSLVVLEAMAAGLPILTTIFNGAREFVTHGKNGYIFNPLDNNEFLAVLNKTYRNRSHLAYMGEQSKIRIANYTHQNVIAKMCCDLQAFFKV
jgi:glycosyltransferase involved in cell wall biosynthesis